MSLARFCHTLAYTELPQLAFTDYETIRSWQQLAPEVAGQALFELGSQRLGRTGKPEEMIWFHGYSKSIAMHQVFIVQYPTPRPFNLPDLTMTEFEIRGSEIVMAPYFSAILFHPETRRIRCVLLGQYPLGYQTTFREVLPNGMNEILPGSIPATLSDFESALADWLQPATPTPTPVPTSARPTSRRILRLTFQPRLAYPRFTLDEPNLGRRRLAALRRAKEKAQIAQPTCYSCSEAETKIDPTDLTGKPQTNFGTGFGPTLAMTATAQRAVA